MYYEILQRLMRELDSLQEKLSSNYLDSQLASTNYGKTIDTYFDITQLDMRDNVVKFENINNMDNVTGDISTLQSSVITLNEEIDELQNHLGENKLVPIYLEKPNFGEFKYPHKINMIQTPEDCEDETTEYFDPVTVASDTIAPDIFSDISGADKLYDNYDNILYNGTLPMTEELKSVYLFFEYRFFHYHDIEHPVSDYPTESLFNIQVSFYNTFSAPVFDNNGNNKFSKDEIKFYTPTLIDSSGLDNLHRYYAGANDTSHFYNNPYLYNFNNYTSSAKIKLFGTESSELNSLAYPFTGEAGMCLVKLPINDLMLMNDITGGKSVSPNFISPFLLNFNIKMWLDKDTYFKTNYSNANPPDGLIPRYFKYQNDVPKYVFDIVGIRQVSLFYSSHVLSETSDLAFYKPGINKYIYNIDYSSSLPTPPPPTPPLKEEEA